MPIEHRIDPGRRLVVARGRGVLTPQEVMAYQLEVWSQAEVAGFDELMDMRDVERIVAPTTDQVQELARLSARMDARTERSRFAIVASTDLAFGIGRMYEAHRSMEVRSTKQVRVFRTMEEATTFLESERDTQPNV
jgi:hypothetical protein